jgi:hypothetical protein
MLEIITRDVRHAVLEVTNQPDQLHSMPCGPVEHQGPVPVVHGN